MAQEEETPRSGVKGFREKRAGLWEEETQRGRSMFAQVIPPQLGSSGEKGFTAEGGGLGGTLEAI